MIIPHCLFILPADVISSYWLRPLTCHLPPTVAMVHSTLVAAVQEKIPIFISVGFLLLTGRLLEYLNAKSILKVTCHLDS